MSNRVSASNARWSVLVYTLACALCVSVASPSAQMSETANAGEIEERVQDLLGLSRLAVYESLSETGVAELVIGVDSTSPFVADKINRQRVWRVKYDNVGLEYERCAEHSVKQREYDFEVYLDSSSGRLLKISLLSDQHDTSLVRKPLAATAEKQLLSHGRTQAVGDPQVNFLAALAGLPKCPLLATEIVGYYWMMDLYLDQTGAQPVWEIYLYGHVSLCPYPSEGETDSDRAHIRFLVDAKTGKWIMGSNDPMAPREESSDE